MVGLVQGITDATSTSTTVSMTEARTISASFTPKNFSLFAVVTPDDAGQVTGSGNYQFGEEANLTAATTMNGYSFLSWSGNINSTHNPLILNIDSNLSLTANFISNTYSLEISAGNGGSVSGDGNFTHGSLAEINATPRCRLFLFRLDRIEGIGDPNSPSTTVLIDQDRTICCFYLKPVFPHAPESSVVGRFQAMVISHTVHSHPFPQLLIRGYIFRGWAGFTDP